MNENSLSSSESQPAIGLHECTGSGHSLVRKHTSFPLDLDTGCVLYQKKTVEYKFFKNLFSFLVEITVKRQ